MHQDTLDQRPFNKTIACVGCESTVRQTPGQPPRLGLSKAEFQVCSNSPSCMATNAVPLPKMVS